MLYNQVEKNTSKNTNIHNYVIPESWNLYGFFGIKLKRTKEIMVEPYDFYLFSLRHILKTETGEWKAPIPLVDEAATNRSWLKKANVYSLMIRTATAWDHDRDDTINSRNLYHMNDNGTFLKSILLLPMLKRMGINTILMHIPFCTTIVPSGQYYPVKECIDHFQIIDEKLADALIPEMCGKQQCCAFIEACHLMGMRVILEYCPGYISINNAYLLQHPSWFYWIDSSQKDMYHPPKCSTLPKNTIPYTTTLKDFYKSEDVAHYIGMFKPAPVAKTDANISYYEKEENLSVAPAINDQINGLDHVDPYATIFRFYEDVHARAPKIYKEKEISYLTQDVLRADLHPGKKPNNGLWNMLNDNIIWYQEVLGIDGLIIEKPHLLPNKLLRQFIKTARAHHEHFVMIAEDAEVSNSSSWVQKGFDAMTGNSAYIQDNTVDFTFHTFAYQLTKHPCPIFAACEAYDSRRISALHKGSIAANMLSVMNLFLPNSIPMMMNGVECYEVQPMQLSIFADQTFLYSLDRTDPRYGKQAYLDQYYFNYSHVNAMVLPSLLEQASHIRKEYIQAISNKASCIPVWFDSPKDFGVGFTFILEKKALMVVCNTNIYDLAHLRIHTENLLYRLAFTPTSILQRFSTEDPYTHDIYVDARQNIPLDFKAGEVKFIELTQ